MLLQLAVGVIYKLSEISFQNSEINLQEKKRKHPYNINN